MQIPNHEAYVDSLMVGIAVIIGILFLLELITPQSHHKPVEEQKKWKESEEDECFYVDKPLE